MAVTYEMNEFQFLLVRLIAGSTASDPSAKYISIPSGAINSGIRHNYTVTATGISIPSGAINRLRIFFDYEDVSIDFNSFWCD